MYADMSVMLVAVHGAKSHVPSCVGCSLEDCMASFGSGRHMWRTLIKIIQDQSCMFVCFN